MKDVTVFVFGDSNITKTLIYDSKVYYNVATIENQLKNLNVTFDITYIEEAEDLPDKVESNLIFFLDNSLYIQQDFVFNAVTLNNLYRDAGIFFGPVLVETKCSRNIRAIKNSYHGYDLGFGEGLQVADITNEQHNHGDLVGSVITGAAYNRIGYSACVMPRATTINNAAFVDAISKHYKIFFCKTLSKVKHLKEEDFDPDIVSDYYYSLGYHDGVVVSLKNQSDKISDLWHRFVESPEVLDNELPRWLHLEPQTEDNVYYLESLVVLKCKYQIGFFEGLLGKKLI